MNKKYVWAIIVIVIVAIVGIYLGSKNSAKSKGFNMGLISILSGDYAAVGENYRNGVVLADEIYNKAHPDAKINLSIEDDGFSGGKGVSAYQKLTSIDKINALINVSTPTIDSIYDTVTKQDIPVIQGGEQGREPEDDNVLGIFPSSIASEYDYGVYMRNKGIKEMTIVYTNNDAMIRFVESFKKGFQGTTTDFVISATEKDFRTHALKASEGNPKTIGLFIFPQQGAQFMKEYLKIAKNKPQFFFDANFQSGFSDYERILGNLSMLDGTLIGTVDLTTGEQFKKDYKERFGDDAGFLADIGYDSFNILAENYSSDPNKWIANIKRASFEGVSGKIEFDEKGNRKPETKIMVIKKGKIADME